MFDGNSGSLDSDISPVNLDIKEDELKETVSQQGTLPPDFNQIKEIAITDGRLHYDKKGRFLFALAPNNKPSHLTEQQWLLSRTDWIKDWLRWEDVFKTAKGEIIERRNFGSELERIRVENPAPELRALANALAYNSPLSQNSNLFLKAPNGTNHSLCYLLNTAELTGKYLFVSQSLIDSQHPPEDIVIRRQADVDETILHEQIHGYTVVLLYLYGKFKAEGQVGELKNLTSAAAVEFAIKAEDLFAVYKAQKGQLNINEFLAYGLTDSKLEARQKLGINALKSMPYTGNKVVSNNVVSEALRNVGVAGSLYDEVFSIFVNYYSQIDPQLYSDRVDENGDPLAEHITLAVKRFRQLNSETTKE